MSIINGIVGQLNKALQGALSKGDTRVVNKINKLIDNPTQVENRLNQIKAKQEGYGDTQVDAPKLGHDKHELQAGSPELPETFIPQRQVQEIFDIELPKPQATSLTETLSKEIVSFTSNFKGALDDMRTTSAIKKLFKDKDVSDRKVAGFAIDTLKVIDENSAGAFKKINGEKVYERVSQQDLLDKLGRKVEARMMSEGEPRLTANERRNIGAVMLEFAKGNMKRFINEDMIKTAKGQKLLMNTSDDFSTWARSGGRNIINAFDDVVEVRNPSVKPHGVWRADADGNIIETPKGSQKADFFAGGNKADISESSFPTVMDSLNILGHQKTGMDKGFYSIWGNLGKKGYFKESPGPVQEFKDNLNKTRMTSDEYEELIEALDVITIRGELEHGGNMTPGQFMKAKSEVFTPRLKALEAIGHETKTLGNQRQSSASATRRIKDELDKRFANDPEAKVHFQYNVDTRGRAYPIDATGANITFGGAIRHGFIGSKKPIEYGDEGFKQIVDDVVLFDIRANLSKIQGSGLDRHSYFLKNKERYFKEGEDALDNMNNPDWTPSWLKGQKDKGPYLRGVMEMARIKRAGDVGQPYSSDMMIEVDAPSSGSQHIGAQYGDEGILWQTSVITEPVGKNKVLSVDDIRNLSEGVPDDSIARDLYTDVGVIYSKNTEDAFGKLAAQDPQKAEAYKYFTDKYLSSGRGVVKPIVMKVPYGAGDDTLRKDLVSQLSGRQRLEMADAGIDPEELMNFHWKNMQGALKEGLKTQYEFKKFNKVLGKIYEKATNKKPFKVEGPSGDITDLTRYIMKIKKTFKGEIKTSRLPDYTGEADAVTVQVYTNQPVKDLSPEGVGGLKADYRDTAQGLAPNITHSLDAAYLHKLVKAAAEQGIELRVVHDAFFTHPNDVKVVKELAGKVFRDMHAGYDLRSKMIEGLAEATGESIEDITQKVLDSKLTLGRKFDIGTVPDEQLTNVIRGG